MRSKLALGMALLGFSAGALADATPGPAEVVAAYYGALAAGDAAAAEALLAPDAVVLESGGVESRAEYLAHHLAADIEFSRAVPSVRSGVRVTQAGDAAWVSASSRAEGALRGRAVRSEGAELIVLTRSERGWQIRAIHWSSRAVKEMAAPPPGAAQTP